MILATLGTLACTTSALVALRHAVGIASYRRLALRRLAAPKDGGRAGASRRLVVSRLGTARAVPADEHESLALMLDTAGRELRLGSSLHAALLTALTRHPVAGLSWLADVARDGDSLRDAAHRRLASSTDDQVARESIRFVLRVVVAASDGADPVHAVESAARTLRTTAAIAADSRAAVAQTLASIRVLTWVPLVVAGLLAWRDDSARRFFLSPGGAACLALGLALNWSGRRITSRLTRHAARADSEIPDFVDMIVVHLRAGRPPASAFLHAAEAAAGPTGASAREVAAVLRGGERFVDALLAGRAAFDLRAQPLIDALVDTERDGLPPRELFERLADEAKSQRRREADRKLRALPVRLTLPLVCCVLPAYVLLAVVPLLVGQLSSVDFGPP